MLFSYLEMKINRSGQVYSEDKYLWKKKSLFVIYNFNKVNLPI